MTDKNEKTQGNQGQQPAAGVNPTPGTGVPTDRNSTDKDKRDKTEATRDTPITTDASGETN